MRTTRRFVNEESGMTLPLAVIMTVLLGVMGAGLLTFVMRDLNTVVEENRGQRAFEVADAGIGAAKQQLASNVVRSDYDGDGLPMEDPEPNCGSDALGESQWSALRCEDPDGLTLTDLDEDDMTPDSVTVTIEYMGDDTDEFLVISEGTYGDPPQQAKRRIEAIFAGIVDGSGGSGEVIGHPILYTDSSIMIAAPDVSASNCNNPVTMDKVSLFSRKDILFQTHSRCPIKVSSTTTTAATAKAQFLTEYDGTQGLIKPQGKDKLCDWNSWDNSIDPAHCFDASMGGTDKWNTVSRTISQYPPGLAAEHLICSVSSASTGECPVGATSIVDGVRGFDSTTSPMFEVKACQLPGATTQCDFNVGGKISYPFPLPAPIPKGFKDEACTTAEVSQSPCNGYNPATVSYFEGTPSTTWGLGNTNFSSNNKVAFVDAQNRTLSYNGSGKGIIVVWCGRLEQTSSFEGIILNLVGDDLSQEGNTSCTENDPTSKLVGGQWVPDGNTVGTYENKGQMCQCWVYSDGGTSTVPGIKIDQGSNLQFRPSSTPSFRNNLFTEPRPPDDFRLQNWRELYQAGP